VLLSLSIIPVIPLVDEMTLCEKNYFLISHVNVDSRALIQYWPVLNSQSSIPLISFTY